MSIIAKIVAGESTWEQVFKHNIAVMDKQVERERNNKHPADGCNVKYCKHGTKRAVQALIDHRDKLHRELQVIKAGISPTDI